MLIHLVYLFTVRWSRSPSLGADRARSAVVLHASFVSLPFPEPAIAVSSRAEVLLGYLDYFRSRLVSKLEALPGGELRRSRLPSGWTPIELLKHVAHDELRWLG